MTGRLVGIARRDARRAPMEELGEASISVERGIEGDHKGAKFPRRQVAVLAIEAWLAACGELAEAGEPLVLPWTVRRANLLVEAVTLPCAKGGIIAIGDVHLEVTGQTVPCGRMDEAWDGLRRALHPEWRGGVTCRVLRGGVLRIGDPASRLVSPPERRVRLPG